MVPAVLYDSNVRVLLYLKIGRYMTKSSTLRTVVFRGCLKKPKFLRGSFLEHSWKSHFGSIAESHAYITDLEVALADDLMKTARTGSSVVLLPVLCMP